jgi:alkaline phosphatase D
MAAFQDFDPFWEFVSGPIHAGTGFQNEIDLTFGPQVVYVKARPRDPAVLGGPADGLQFFGHVAIDGATEVMTVTLKDAADTVLWSRQIEPQAA